MTTDLWKVLNYEIQMYIGAEMLQKMNLTSTNRMIQTITDSGLTELKILHIRILTEIFMPPRPKYPDDIKIDDLVPTWRDENKSVLMNLQNAYNEAVVDGMSPKTILDKFLAHATKERGDHFDWAPITRRMDAPLRKALLTLPDENLSWLKFMKEN